MSWKTLVIFGILIPTTYQLSLSAQIPMRCSYGERGSLTATCVNATPSFFRGTSYRFDNLDETLRCIDCNLAVIESNTFDISGNTIKSMDLSYSKINTLKESSFVGLVFLENLYLQNNEIRSVIPLTFRGIKKLIKLNLENNTISIILGDSFKELINLQTLNMKNNKIKTIDVLGFNGLVQLKDLNLRFNELREVKDIFNPLFSIETIDVEHNQITEIHNHDFTNLSNIIELNLARNVLRNIPGEVFQPMHKLQKLDLSWNPLEELQKDSFKGLIRLEELDIDNGVLKSIPKETLQGLHNLRILQVSNNRIAELKTGMFSGLPELKILNISSNKIKDLERTGVFPLHSLHTFDISHNNLSDLDFRLLAYHMPRLSYLAVEGNQFPCYLIGEIKTFFNDDNIKVTIDDYDPNNCHVISPAFKNLTEEVVQSLVKEQLPKVNQNSHNAAMYTIFIFLLLLVGVLFYLQFRTFRLLNGSGKMGERKVSQVQLISNDLESHENEFYKEMNTN